MEKKSADTLIVQYREKIFGFALEKMRNISEAQELASDIVCEVYTSFLKADNIVNPDGYVYRIASNVYARYIHRLTTGRRLEDISETAVPYFDKGLDELENSETLAELRREIGFLSQRQRTIIYLHYYDKKSVAEIAKELNISAGTVKWHLSDARSSIKEELTMERFKDDLAVNPIKFIGMGHNGSVGAKGDTADMFDTRLKQNIAFSCYYEPQTAEEIARKLNVPVTYVADELKILCEYGYIDAVDNSKNPKYLTNMYITDTRNNDGSAESENRKAAAKFLCDKFYPKVFEDFDKSEDNWGFFCDGNDKNFMKYTLVMLCTNLAYSSQYIGGPKYWEEYEKLSVKRPDGGKFIAHAAIANEYYEEKPDDHYWCCGYMNTFICCNTPTPKIGKISIDCRYSDRSKLQWRDDINTDWAYLYDFIKGGCKPESLAPENYKRLCDKGYIYNDKVQVMCMNSSDVSMSTFRNVIRSHVNVSDEIPEYAKEFDKRRYEMKKDQYPEHIQPILQLYCNDAMSDALMIPYIIEEMLERGMLKPLTDLQKKSVFTAVVYPS
ncbi:MAG: sigma-70 family RNA polymerase sigma factor [Oscillospiraceae bacterium]|nr:sigma-70 family RNA polymerase sigma factor [Oscillospiraceae bacterium]